MVDYLRYCSRMGREGSDLGWKMVKYTAIGMEIPIMAFVGYMIGKSIGDRELQGILLGLLLGTLLTYYNAWRAFKSTGKLSS